MADELREKAYEMVKAVRELREALQTCVLDELVQDEIDALNRVYAVGSELGDVVAKLNAPLVEAALDTILGKDRTKPPM